MTLILIQWQANGERQLSNCRSSQLSLAMMVTADPYIFMSDREMNLSSVRRSTSRWLSQYQRREIFHCEVWCLRHYLLCDGYFLEPWRRVTSPPLFYLSTYLDNTTYARVRGSSIDVLQLGNNVALVVPISNLPKWRQGKDLHFLSLSLSLLR